MNNNDSIFIKIAEALLADFTTVYYVNAVTNEYQWYSANPVYHSLKLENHGKDFFTDLVRDADQLIYEDDKRFFMVDMQKENLLAQMKKGTMQSIEYRMMIDGKPVYHALRMIRGLHEGDDYFILGVLNVDKEVRRRLAAEKAERERDIYTQIADSLAAHYDTLYFIDIETNHYFEISSTDSYKSLNVPQTGEDFFEESRKNIAVFVHPDDRDRVLKLHYKEELLLNLQRQKFFTSTHRLILNGEIMHCRYHALWASDKKHIIVGIENINSEVQVEQELAESRRQTITYSQIAESLALHYDVVYYVDMDTGKYAGFTVNSIYGKLDVQEQGDNFFRESHKNARKLIYMADRARILQILDRDYMISALEDKKQAVFEYRMVIGEDVRHTRMTAMWASDRVHIIIGVENIDEEVKRKSEQIEALNQANEKARRDELTGVRNKNAFQELEDSVQAALDKGEQTEPFGIAVCDINNLKVINDTLGHKAGDDYIRAACKIICTIFAHSPVYRIGGDEFAVFLKGGDYDGRERLTDEVLAKVRENMCLQNQPVFAVGCAVYRSQKDKRFSDVFERADKDMYANKLRLKEDMQNLPEQGEISEMSLIPAHCKKHLDSLFEAFSVVAGGAYVYLCNMHYDYSRWSKNAVDAFGLPSEYMYRAGDLWEAKIHPEDREIYHAGIERVFTGKTDGHDMQYRAQRPDGGYDVCTCHGLVIKNEYGDPEYFGGVIRNHGIQGHIDALTGLRNLYGFFEDLQTGMFRSHNMLIIMIGVRKFSEINEMYGYLFGNTILQRVGRYLYEEIGNAGSVYRLDGTKFAVISMTLDTVTSREKYETMRTYFRGNFQIDNKAIILDINGGMLTVDNFGVDYQTVYACLNFAYNMSKVRMQGDLVEFYNNLSDENKHRIEKLHAIRASIMKDYHGFYLLYQPFVDAQNETLLGAEALLRWKSDEYGMVPPDHFIPILEKDPYFCDLGEWILRTAISAAQIVMQSCPDFIINVNIAYTQLERPDFVDMVIGILRETGFPPSHLCLEITERCRLLDMDHLKNVVTNLRGQGVLIALDDFGTGFSSIGVVKSLPFDIIKIDRSFVCRIEEDDKDRKLIKLFAGMASTFGAKVCVEGVETSDMRNILQEYSIRSFQGYYYSKPLTLEDFLEWLQRYQS